MKSVLQDPNRNLRELLVADMYPYQIIVEALQQAMQQFTWTLGNLKYTVALLFKHLSNNMPVHPLDTSDDYFSKTTSSMEASAVAALEWACVADWRSKPDDTMDWMSWMYERVEQLTIIIMEQRIEWDRKGPEHPDVLYLNNERRKFFQDLLAGNIPTLRKALEERDDEVIRLFDDIPSIANDTSTNSKKPRLFKNGIL